MRDFLKIVDFGHCECLNRSQCLKKHFKFDDVFDGKSKILRMCNSFLTLKLEAKLYKIDEQIYYYKNEKLTYNSFLSPSYFLRDVLIDIFIEHYNLDNQQIFKYQYYNRKANIDLTDYRIPFMWINKPFTYLYIDIKYFLKLIEEKEDNRELRYILIDGIDSWLKDHCRTKVNTYKHRKLISLLKMCKHVSSESFNENFKDFMIECFVSITGKRIKEKRSMNKLNPL